MKTGCGGGRNSSATKEAREEAGSPKPKQQEVCGEISGTDGYSKESL